MTTLRWATIGLGVGEQHAEMVASLAGSILVGICDRDPETLARVQSRFSGIAAFTDPEQTLDMPGLDAVVLATYDDSHAELVISALRKGIHVFVEKPLATTESQLMHITYLLNANRRLRLSSNTLLRLSPPFRWLKAELDSGRLGVPYHAEMTYLYGRLEKVTHGWRGTSPDYSVTLGGSIHMIDLLLWLTGERPSRCLAIRSSLGTTASELGKGLSQTPDDLRLALLEFPSGLTAQVGANFACVIPHFHSLALFGTEKSVLHYPQGFHDSRSSMVVYTDRNPSTEPQVVELPYPAVPKGSLLPGFAEAIRGGPLIVSEQEVVDAMSVALAIDTAALSRSPVEIGYFPVETRQASA